MLAFFDIAFDPITADVTGGANVVRWRPQNTRFPYLATNLLTQLLTQTARCNAFEKLCQISGAIPGWSRHEKVHVVRHHLTGKKLETVLNCDLVERLSQTVCHLSSQDAAAILGTPNKVIVQVVHCALGAFHVHILIIAQMFYIGNLEEGRSMAASSPDSMSRVSATENL